MDYDDLLMATYALWEQMATDKFRPRYHFCPTEGRWNDVNGMLYWKGRYHAGYLQKIRNGPGQRDFSSQQHISSRDLVHWRYHTAALREPLPGSKGDYFNSGDVVLVQRVYPTRDDSRQFSIFSRDGALTVTNIVKWEMDASNPW